jgi:hypothetical protein
MPRPIGVSIIGVVVFFCAASILLIGIVSVLGGAAFIQSVGHGARIEIVVGAIYILYAVICGVAGFGLMELRNWGRILTIVLLALAAASEVIVLLKALLGTGSIGEVLGSGLLIVLIDVSGLWYLLRVDVKQVFKEAT